MDILGKRNIWYTISLIILITGLFFLVFKGLNLGIDFQGGTLLEFKFDHEVSNNEVREILNDTGVAKDAILQQSVQQEIYGILIRASELSPKEIVQIEDALTGAYPSTEMLRTDVVGPIIGKELRVKALIALLLASIAIVFYISIRFEFRFAIVAIIALLGKRLIHLLLLPC